MTADASARDREAELATIGPVALAGIELKARAPQPGDGEILERMADGEDAQPSFGVAVNSNCRARSQAWPRREPPRESRDGRIA